ncbi:MAG: carboxylesterase/lipase family protein [Ilumatobacteraceae bacterium]
MTKAVRQYRNIVYAYADRFRPPVLVDQHVALATPVQCPQVPGLLEQAMGTADMPMDEQCLTLNVFSPDSPTTLLPVVVWIHGGAFTNGTGNASWYDGSNLASRGCVVVAVNYRLGSFGFTGHADVGLQDQIAALTWVRNNIQRFGGDADNVTIFGESAGGCSVVALYASPSAKSLFHRGWAMSPSLGQLRTLSRAAESKQRLLADLHASSLSDIDTTPHSDMIASQGRLLRDPKDVVTMFSPTVGGDVVAANAHDLIAQDERPLVIGTMRDESRLWVALNPSASSLTQEAVLTEFESRFGDSTHHAWNAYQSLRPGSSPAQMLAAMQSDESFRVPAWRVVDARDKAGCATWKYFFTWPTPVFDGILGACHGLDIPFVFDNVDAPNVEHFIGVSPAHRHLADTLAGALLEFAANANPGWHPTNGTRTVLRVDERNETVVDLERELYDLWVR